jgi:hypothetical protein
VVPEHVVGGEGAAARLARVDLAPRVLVQVRRHAARLRHRHITSHHITSLLHPIYITHILHPIHICKAKNVFIRKDIDTYKEEHCISFLSFFQERIKKIAVYCNEA